MASCVKIRHSSRYKLVTIPNISGVEGIVIQNDGNHDDFPPRF